MQDLAPLGNVFQAGTLSGNPAAMAAGYSALSILMQKAVYKELQEKADFLLLPLEKALEKTPHSLEKVGSLFSIHFYEKKRQSPHLLPKSKEAFRRFFLHLLSQGIYFSPSPLEAQFISASHTKQHLLQTQEAVLQFIEQEKN